MKCLWTEDTGAGLHFWELVNQLFFNDALVVESKESNQGLYYHLLYGKKYEKISIAELPQDAKYKNVNWLI